jgi:hypothetical protein
MALQSSSTVSSTGFVTVTIYGGVSTNTYTTTITASGIYSQASITALSWPTPTTTEPIEYTSFPIPTDPASKYFSGLLPIVVVTVVDGVVVNTVGQPITTIAEVQAQPAYVLYNPAPVNTRTECSANFYTCWSTSQKAGIILAIILGGLLILIFLIWFCCFMRIPRSRKPDEEEDDGIRARDREQGPDGDGGSRRKRMRNSDLYSAAKQGRKGIKRKHSSLSSGSSPEPPKPFPRIVTAEDYREIRRVSSIPQHVLSSETSSGSTGRRAVVGVGVRDSSKDGMLLPSAAACDTTVVLNATKASNAATIPATTARARVDLDIPQREIRRDSGKRPNIDQKQRGTTRIPKRSSSNVSARPQRFDLG